MEITYQQMQAVSTIFYQQPVCRRTIDENGKSIKQTQPEEKPLFCLLSRKTNIPEKCCKNCEKVEWRLLWESTSPAFFGELLRVSEAAKRLENKILFENSEMMNRQFQELQLFFETVFTAIYPLFLACGSEFPFLMPKDIQKEREIFLLQGEKPIEEEMKKMGWSWHNEVSKRVIRIGNWEYSKNVFYIIQLFFAGREIFFNKIKQEVMQKMGQP